MRTWVALAVCLFLVPALLGQQARRVETGVKVKETAPLKVARVWDWWQKAKFSIISEIKFDTEIEETRLAAYRSGTVDQKIESDVDETPWRQASRKVLFKSAKIKREKVKELESSVAKSKTRIARLENDAEIQYPVIWRTDNADLSPWALNEAGNIGRFEFMLVVSAEGPNAIVVKPYEWIAEYGSYATDGRPFVRRRTDSITVLIRGVNSSEFTDLIGQVVFTTDAFELREPSKESKSKGYDYEADPFDIEPWLERPAKDAQGKK